MYQTQSKSHQTSKTNKNERFVFQKLKTVFDVDTSGNFYMPLQQAQLDERFEATHMWQKRNTLNSSLVNMITSNVHQTNFQEERHISIIETSHKDFLNMIETA